MVDVNVAEHSFRARSCAQNIAKKNKHAVNAAIILSYGGDHFIILNTHTICAIFLYNRTQCIEGFTLLLQKICTLEKMIMQRNQKFSAFSLLPNKLS